MHRILDKLVAVELVADTMTSKIIPYVQRHNLNLDGVLLSYIKVRSFPFGYTSIAH